MKYLLLPLILLTIGLLLMFDFITTVFTYITDKLELFATYLIEEA